MCSGNVSPTQAKALSRVWTVTWNTDKTRNNTGPKTNVKLETNTNMVNVFGAKNRPDTETREGSVLWVKDQTGL